MLTDPTTVAAPARKDAGCAKTEGKEGMVWKRFTEHPASVGETYTEHMAMAGSFGLRMLLGAMACLVHAVFPFLFEKTGSTTITTLHHRMVTHRQRKPALPAKAASELGR